MRPIPTADNEPFKIEDIEPTAENAQRYFPPTCLGPTWQRDTFGQWLLPEKTLGWQILGWAAEWLCNPEGGPWLFTDEQARFILWMYAVDDDGDFIWQNAVLQRLKGWGKDPLAAVLCLVELVGPCRFDYWDADGNPVARVNHTSWVQITAVNLEQTKNTMLLIPSLLPERTRQEFGLEVQKQIVQVIGNGGRRIEVVSASFRSLEGNRPSFAIANETHHWIPSRGGQDFFNTLRANLDKTDGRLLCITNAYQPGEQSVAEDIRLALNRFLDGLAEDPGWLYDSIEAHADAPLTLEWAPHIVAQIRGDAVWLKIKTITKSLRDTSIPPSRHRRMWYNQITTSEDALFSEGEWDRIAVYGARPDGTKCELALERRDQIVLGFDGGKTDDATALVAIRISDRTIFPLQIWQKPEGHLGDNWQVPQGEVDGMVRMAFREYDVQAFFADVALWESYIADWSDDFREKLLIKASAISAVGYDMRGNAKDITRGNEALIQAVRDGRVSHNGDPLLRRHALNARVKQNDWGISFRKDGPESPNKVDGYAATLLAYMALIKLSESGKKPQKKHKRRLRRS